MGKAKIAAIVGEASVRTRLEYGAESTDDATALAVRFLLQVLEDAAPGNTLEVRVPPYGAVQCVEGPRHTRGTPPNVIELEPATWVSLATGSLSWSDAIAKDLVSASGSRANLEGLLPLEWNKRE